MLTLSDQHYILSYIGSKLKILFTYQIVTQDWRNSKSSYDRLLLKNFIISKKSSANV